MIIGRSGSGKTNALLNLISKQDDIDKIYLYAKSESKYEFLIKKPENAGIKYFNDPNAFIECLNTMDDIYENNDDYNPNRQRKKIIAFDDMIADIMSDKIFQAIIKELFIRCIRCRKLNISLVFITQYYFSVPKDVRLNLIYYLIWKSTTKNNYKIFQLIFWQILIITILWGFTENAQENRILFWQSILRYQQVIP